MTRINNSITYREKSYWDAGIALWDEAIAKITAFVVGLLGSKYTPMAEKAQRFVQRNILFSSTFPNRNIHFKKNKARDFGVRLNGINTGIHEVRASLEGTHRSPLNKAKVMGKTAIKYSIGNCMEMAAAAFVYLLEAYPDVKVDIYHIVGGDHCFLVIGRDVNSNPTDPKTWGPHALICDPWSKESFPVFELEKLKDFAGNVYTDGYPVLRELDFNTQTLGLWVSNHLTENDLKYLGRVK